MITKVSYKPYASNISSIKNQPQKVNFGANVNPSLAAEALTPEAVELAKFFRARLISLVNAGAKKDAGAVNLAMKNIFDLLRMGKISTGQLGRASEEMAKRRVLGGVLSLF